MDAPNPSIVWSVCGRVTVIIWPGRVPSELNAWLGMRVEQLRPVRVWSSSPRPLGRVAAEAVRAGPAIAAAAGHQPLRRG